MHIDAVLYVAAREADPDFSGEILDVSRVFDKEGVLRGLAALEDLFLHYAGTDDTRADAVLSLIERIWPAVQGRFSATVRRYLHNDLRSF